MTALAEARAAALRAKRDEWAAGAERGRVEGEQLEQRKAVERRQLLADGLLGQCPKCGREVDTFESVVLAHLEYMPHPLLTNESRRGIPDCKGTGELALPIGGAS